MTSNFPKYLNIALREDACAVCIAYTMKDGTEIYDLEAKLLIFFWQFFKFTIKFVFSEDKVIGEPLENGNWTGVIGLLQHGKADLSFFMEGISEEKMKVVDFSYPLFISGVTFMTQQPRPLEKNLQIFYPFSGIIWIAFICSMFGFSLLFSAMKHREKRFVYVFFATVGNVLGQPFDVHLPSTKHVILFVGWIVALTFLVHGYKATLLSFILAIPTKGISTIDELASGVVDGSVQCRSHPGYFYVDYLMNSSIESHKIIGKYAYENSKNYDNIDIYNDPYGAQTTAYIDSEWTFGGSENEFVISKDVFFYEMFGFMLSKDFCCKKALNKNIRRMVEGGFIDKILSDYFGPWIIITKVGASHLDEDEIITLNDLKGPFVILIFGHILASCTFVAEIFFYKLSQRSSQNRRRSNICKNLKTKFSRCKFRI